MSENVFVLTAELSCFTRWINHFRPTACSSAFALRYRLTDGDPFRSTGLIPA